MNLGERKTRRTRTSTERPSERRRRKWYRCSPHLHRQCLTSVAVARPPRDESITLNNVNVSPSQHKTNNHCSLPRPMGMASSRGSPAPRSPLPSLVSTSPPPPPPPLPPVPPHPPGAGSPVPPVPPVLFLRFTAWAPTSSTWPH